MNAIAHSHQLLMPLDVTPRAATVGEGVPVATEALLPGDTHHGRDLYEAACAWSTDTTAMAFVRAEVRGARVLVSVCRFVGPGEGELVSGVLGGAHDAEVRARLEAVLMRVRDVVLVGHAVEHVQPLLDFGAHIIARRSMFSVRALEVGFLNAMRDEAFAMTRGRESGGDLDDPVARGWLVERAHADLCSLVVSRGATASIH